MLTTTSKRIIAARLYDKGIHIQASDLDNYIVDIDKYDTLDDMYNSIVENYGKLIIE